MTILLAVLGALMAPAVATMPGKMCVVAVCDVFVSHTVQS